MHCSLRTTYYALLTTHCFLRPTRSSLLTTHYSLLTTHYSLLTRPRLQHALAPYLAAFEEADSVVAIHIRSGWVGTPVERVALVRARLAASATWDAKPRAWAALRIPEARLSRVRPQRQPVALPPSRVRGLSTYSYHLLLTTYHLSPTTRLGRRLALSADQSRDDG